MINKQGATATQLHTATSNVNTNANSNASNNDSEMKMKYTHTPSTVASSTVSSSSSSSSSIMSMNKPKCSSMTLAITASNASRMLEASRALNASFKKLQLQQQQQQQQEEAKDKVSPSTADRNNNTSKSDTNNNNSNSIRNISDELIKAAKTSSDQLLTSFVNSMQENVDKNMANEEDMIISLLLFLDMDKSSKLLTAFEVLNMRYDDHGDHDHSSNSSNNRSSSNDCVDTNDNGNDKGNENDTKPSDFKVGSSSPSPSSSLESAVKHEETETTSTTQDIQQKEDQRQRQEKEISKTTERVRVLPKLKQKEIMRLFQAFLTSISTCIHYKETGETLTSTSNSNSNSSESNKKMKVNENDSPSSSSSLTPSDNLIMASDEHVKLHPTSTTSSSSSSDATSTSTPTLTLNDCTKNWTVSLCSKTRKEIEEIAIYATERVIEDAATKNKISSSSTADNATATATNNTTTTTTSSDSDKAITVGFQEFGEWYNSGGFSIVPWLELLDLAKWDQVGRAAAAAAASKKKQLKRSSSLNSGSSISGSGNSTNYQRSQQDHRQSLQQPHHHHPGIMDTIMENVTHANSNKSSKHDKKNRSSGLSPMVPDLFLQSPMPQNSTTMSSFTTGHAHATTASHSSSSSSHPNSHSNQQHSSMTMTKPLISFEFANSNKYNIKINEENLRQLQHLVKVTDLSHRTPGQVANVLLRHSNRRRVSKSSTSSASSSSLSQPSKSDEVIMVLNREDFKNCIRDLIPSETLRQSSPAEMEIIMTNFMNFFLFFANMNQKSNHQHRHYNSGNSISSSSGSHLGVDFVDTKELAVGLSFLCSGNKSAKLSSTFEFIVDSPNLGYLSQRKLLKYLRSYLTMLVSISFLSSSESYTIEIRNALLALGRGGGSSGGEGMKHGNSNNIRRELEDKLNRIFESAEVGSRWTLNHFMSKHEMKKNGSISSNRENDHHHQNRIFFEDFAAWYTDGGYTIAPWLEFLDLRKFVSLLNETHSQQSQLQHQSKTSITGTKTTTGTVKAESCSSSSSQMVLPLNPSSASSKGRSFADECFGISPQRHNSKSSSATATATKSQTPPAPSSDVLFTFPLANRQSLVVLREDAAYVRTVVDQLGLLSLTPEEVWDGLYAHTKKNPPSPLSYRYSKCHKSAKGKGSDVDQKIFVEAIEKVMPSKMKNRKRNSSSSMMSSPQETLKNFFQSFDLDQVDRVAANQLMGGLALLCGGKKSSKLAFAFGLFDMREDTEMVSKKKNAKKSKAKQANNENKSLSGKELFYFLRSFLIVMFSCCKQSLDLSADDVSRYISDTANMATDDVMRYQWQLRQSVRVNFDDFGEWYNEGGFEKAPWLELLDLNKWVLLDQAKAEKMMTDSTQMSSPQIGGRRHLKDKSNNQDMNTMISPTKKAIEDFDITTCSPHLSLTLPLTIPQPPSPPPDDAIDPNTDTFFDDIELDGIGGEIGDMGFLFHDTVEKENEEKYQQKDGISSKGVSPYRTIIPKEELKPLKFQLFTNESNVYTISISSQRVRLLKHLVTESNLCNVAISTVCNNILPRDKSKQISKDRFDSVMDEVISDSNMSDQNQKSLNDLLCAIFNAFDFNKLGKADATELACGLTVLCGGRKSDKLEHAFELLDKKKKGLVSRFQMVRYLQSFLLVLLNISSCPIGSESAEDILYNQEGEKALGNMTLAKVICGASSWATEEIFKATPNDKKAVQEGTEHIDFDNFADWYTRGGYNRIAWIELLDLRKWVLAE